MKSLLGLAFCCAIAAQTPEAAKATISNVGSEPAPYVPEDTPKPVDTYSQAFITRPVTVIAQPAVKYIARSGKKGSCLTDLEKARFYIDRRISALRQQGTS